MTVINTNVKALFAQAALKRTDVELSTAMQQLSTGKRINSAKDDAAGLAIATRMDQHVRSLNQAVRNAGDAISLIQTAEGATNAISDMLQRMRELTVQALNDTNSEEQRGFLDLEFQQLKEEILHISDTTEWNGFQVLNGTAGEETELNDGSRGGKLTFHIGAHGSDVLTIILPDFGAEGSITSGVTSLDSDLNLTTPPEGLMDTIDDALNKVNAARSQMGGVMNRLQYVIENLTNVSMNTSASQSRIEDADYAEASSAMARSQIMQQASTAVLAQANTSLQTVLKLLQG